jgi:uncharacterized protein YcgI (DUF1989 family)
MPTETVVVEAQTGRAVRADAGSLISVVDIEGTQVGDLFAFSVDDPTEHLSTGHTRSLNRTLFPEVGQAFISNRGRPILTFVADTSPGYHDMLFAPCGPAVYRLKFGVDGWHPSCEENFRLATKDAGYEFPTIPDPVNVFQNSPLEDGTLVLKRAQTRPGDRFTVRAEMDVLFVLTACSSDLAPTNGGRCTSLAIEVLSPDEAAG